MSSAAQIDLKRRRFRFGLRGLLTAFAGMALVLGLFRAHFVRAERQRYVIREVQRLGGTVWFTDDHEIMHGWYTGKQDLPADQNGLRYFVPGSYRGTIERVDLDETDVVPERLLLEIAQLPKLRDLAIAPPTSKSPVVASLKQSRPDLNLEVRWQLRHAPITTISSAEGFREAISEDRTILFLDMPSSNRFFQWRERQAIAELATKLAELPQTRSIKVFRLEYLQKQSAAALACQAWIQSLPKETVYGHTGNAIWISRGRVMKFHHSPDLLDPAELLEFTEKAWLGDGVKSLTVPYVGADEESRLQTEPRSK